MRGFLGLFVYFGDLRWRSVGTVGTGEIHTFENDTGPDDANHARYGIVMQTGAPADVAGAHVMDIGPTVLAHLGVDALPDAEGKSLT